MEHGMAFFLALARVPETQSSPAQIQPYLFDTKVAAPSGEQPLEFQRVLRSVTQRRVVEDDPGLRRGFSA